MKFKTSSYLIILIVVLGLTVCKTPTEKAFDPEIADKLQTALQDAVKNPDTNFPGALLYISSPEIGTWAGAAGLSNIKMDTARKPS